MLLLSSAAPAACGSYLYAWGGFGGVSSCWVAQVGPAGTLSAWTPTVAYPTTIKEHWSAVIGDTIYSIAGDTAPNSGIAPTNLVYSAPTLSLGGVVGWVPQPPLPGARYQPVAWTDPATWGLYASGGWFALAGQNTEWSAPVSGGLVGTWMTVVAGPTLLVEHASCQIGGYAVIYNGTTAYAGTLGLWTAPVGGGTIGAWSSQPMPPTTVLETQLVPCGGTMYTIGGLQGPSVNGPAVSACYRATVSGGVVSGWTSVSPLPVAIAEHAVAVADGYIFSLGGTTSNSLLTGVSSVYSAQILGNGNLSSWTSQTALPITMLEHRAEAVCWNAQGTPVACACSIAPSYTPSASATSSASSTRTATRSSTASAWSSTPSGSPSVSPTVNPSSSVTGTATTSATATVSDTPAPVPSATQTNPSPTATATATASPASSPTATASPTDTATGTITRTATESRTPSESSTAGPSSTETATPTLPAAPPFLWLDRNWFRAQSDRLGIVFALADDADVRIGIYDSAGERVRLAFAGPVSALRLYTVTWDGTNEQQEPVASNVYVVRMFAGVRSFAARVGVKR